MLGVNPAGGTSKPVDVSVTVAGKTKESQTGRQGQTRYAGAGAEVGTPGG